MDDEDIVSRTCDFRGTKEEKYDRKRGRIWKQQEFLISSFVTS